MRRRARKPATFVRLLDLAEIRELYGIGHERIYAAVARGDLTAFGRPGRQKYYSSAEIIDCFDLPDDPTTPPALKRRDNGASSTGGQQERFTFSGDELAA